MSGGRTPSGQNREQGLSLVEVLVAMALLALILQVTAALVLSANRQLTTLSTRSTAQAERRLAYSYLRDRLTALIPTPIDGHSVDGVIALEPERWRWTVLDNDAGRLTVTLALVREPDGTGRLVAEEQPAAQPDTPPRRQVLARGIRRITLSPVALAAPAAPLVKRGGASPPAIRLDVTPVGRPPWPALIVPRMALRSLPLHRETAS